MSRDSRVNYNLRVSLIELLTDLIALTENAIIIKYYWKQFPTKHSYPIVYSSFFFGEQIDTQKNLYCLIKS